MLNGKSKQGKSTLFFFFNVKLCRTLLCGKTLELLDPCTKTALQTLCGLIYITLLISQKRSIGEGVVGFVKESCKIPRV